MREGGDRDSLVAALSLSTVVICDPKHSHHTQKNKTDCQLDTSEFSGNTESLGLWGVPPGDLKSHPKWFIRTFSQLLIVSRRGLLANASVFI